jgi:hypothetical protein
MPSLTRALTLAVALPMILLTVGCTAADKHDYYSTVNQPTSVTLIDTYRGEEVWSMDIPVNHKLSFDFKGNVPGNGGSGAIASSSVSWKLNEVSDKPKLSGHGKTGKLVKSDTVDLTGKRVRMLVHYRTSPEMPGSIDAAPVPTQETAESVAAEAIAESKAVAPMAQEQADPQADAPAQTQADEHAEAEEVEVVEQAVEETAEEVVVEEIEDAAPAATQPTK